ncbi:MAG: condensin complex protein MksE [bacterium]
MTYISKSAEIFEWLSKGNFISSNAIDKDIQNYYTIIENNFSSLYELYEQVGYTLEEGNNYYYLAKIDETKQLKSAEYKIEKAKKWIDIMAFFTTFDPAFTRGYRFSPSNILQEVEVNLDLKEQLEELNNHTSQKSNNYLDILNSVLKNMKDEGFIDLENERSQTYKVLDAWHYLEQMAMAVDIAENEDETKNAEN